MLRSLIVAAVLSAAGSAVADSEARKGDDVVRIFDTPCVSAETLARIQPHARSMFSKAQGVFGGQKFFGCWVKMDDDVFVIWEDGDRGVIPKADLKPVLEI